MPARHVVPITPSLPVRLAPLLGYKQNEQTNFHSPYTLPSSVSCKSGVCHSYENTGGVGVFFPFWDSPVSCCGFDAGNERLSESSTNYCHRITDRPSIGLHRPYKGHCHSCFKSFTCNTYGPPCKCCKQKTYCLAKSFRCNTYKKEGWGCLSREHRTSPRGRETRHSQGRSLQAHPLFPIPKPFSMLLYILTSLLLSFSHEREL